VNYAGLPGDKYHNSPGKYAPKGAGAVFTFSLKGGYDPASAWCRT
jgi:O-acetylhomoserine (thiol)-lyase